MKNEQSKLQVEISEMKKSISEVFEFKDMVRGFDVRDIDDPFDQLDIYKDFLGDEEYHKVAQNYQKTIETMDLVFQAELQRLKVLSDLNEDLNERNLTGIVEKFEYIYD